MELPAPTTLAEVVIDGAIAQAASTFALREASAPMHDVTFNPLPGGYQVDIRSGNEVQSFFAVTSARIEGSQWHWRQQFAFDILELQGTQPGSDALVAAARTLNGNGPSYFVPFGNGTFDFVVLQQPVPTLPLRKSLHVGLGAIPTLEDLPRALLAFAAERSLSIEQQGDFMVLAGEGEQVRVDLKAGSVEGSMQLFDVLSDAFFTSTEHQLFYEGSGSPELLDFDPKTGRTPLGSAVLAATISRGRFQFTFQQPQPPSSAEPMASLRTFAVDQGVAGLLRPEWTVEEAQHLRLEIAAKPVLNRFTHAFCTLDHDTVGLLLLDNAPLPPLSKAAAIATLSVRTPEHIDARRSLDFYAKHRGCRLIATDQHTAELECGDGRVLISFEGRRIVGVHDTSQMGA